MLRQVYVVVNGLVVFDAESVFESLVVGWILLLDHGLRFRLQYLVYLVVPLHLVE